MQPGGHTFAMSGGMHEVDAAMSSKRTTANGCLPVGNGQSLNGRPPVDTLMTPTTPGAEDGTSPKQVRRKSKTVSFHSATSLPTERKISSVTDCLQYLISGSSLIKVRPNCRQYHRFFTLSEDLTALRWTPTSKKSSKAMVPIESIREIRMGKNTGTLRSREMSLGYSEDCVFSIIYGDEFESLDLVAATPEEANIWVTGLNALIGAQKSPDGLEEKSSLRERWLQAVFQQAAPGGAGWLDEGATIELLKRLAGDADDERIRQKLAEFDQLKSSGARGRIDSTEFIDIFKEVATRPEIYFLLIRFANKDYLTIEDLQLFLEAEQGMSGPTPEKCRQIIAEYEPNPEAGANGQLLIDGFTKFLLSSECDIFDPSQRSVCQDMTQPLAHYFISTSHNTYLMEDQLKGPSSIEGYVRALAAGCRCIKVDCWDGMEEPVVYHGNTLTSKIYFRDVIQVVNDYAFAVSEYPVIIHLENHCCIRQQRRMARLMVDVFGKRLYLHPPDMGREVCQMSPEELKGKILLLGKKLSGAVEIDAEGEVSEEDENGDISRWREQPRKTPLCKELSELFCLGRTRFEDFPSARQTQGSREIFSMSESSSSKLVHACPEELGAHTNTFLCRVFPNASRVDSSNFNPQDFWNCGCQMVGLNFQTPGQMMDLQEARFRQNGNCGYVLKPLALRDPLFLFGAAVGSRDAFPGMSPQILRLKVISGQHLPRPRGSTAKANVIDPYVLVQVCGIPADCTERKTRTVSNEGDCPVFEETFEFPIVMPELALIRLVVLDDDYIGDDFIGQYSCPFDCLQTGYRHIRLLSSGGEQLENSSLFVHVAITNRKGGGKPFKKSKSDKIHTDIRSVGLKQLDELFKSSVPVLSDAVRMRTDAESALEELRAECGLGDTSSVRQCLRVLALRLSTCSEVRHFSIQEREGFPSLEVDTVGPLATQLQRCLAHLERVLVESKDVVEQAGPILEKLQDRLALLLDFYEEVETQSSKGRKYARMLENYSWNMRLLRGQADLLRACQKESAAALHQVQNSAPTIDNMANSRERNLSGSGATGNGSSSSSGGGTLGASSGSGTLRERPRLNFLAKRPSWDSLPPPPPSLGRSPTSPGPLTADMKPKSILKKSVSSLDQGSLGNGDTFLE